MDDTDPIMEAVEQFIASIPTDSFEDKPVMLAFLNWCRSQDIDRAQMCSVMATLLGLIIGAVAEDKAHRNKGVKIYAEQIRGAASLRTLP
jgi:hypothetical protein